MVKEAGPQVPDGFELIKDGTARLVIDGEVWRLRRPKVGEFRKLRELLQERDDEHVRVMAQAVADTSNVETKAEEDKVERTLAARAQQRQVALAVEDLNIGWVSEALRTLVMDKEPPPVDEWPSGMETLGFITTLIDHWRTVPLARGVG